MKSRLLAFLPPLLVFLLTLLLFAPARSFQLVDLDDESYIGRNALLSDGLTFSAVRDAFTSAGPATMYLPLLWVSYMADITLFGAGVPHPAPFHATNIALHAFDALLLYFLLLRLSRQRLPALLLALHAAVNHYTPSHWVTCDLSKRSALRLALASSGQNWTLAGFAPDAPVFYYFGGIPSIASYYWENAAGWHAEAPLLADTSDAAANARALAAERHISRILIRTDSFLPELYAYVAHDITNAYAAQFHTLLGRLAHAPRTMPPFWLTPDADLSAAFSQSTLYALPGDNCYAKTNLPWTAYALSPNP